MGTLIDHGLLPALSSFRPARLPADGVAENRPSLWPIADREVLSPPWQALVGLLADLDIIKRPQVCNWPTSGATPYLFQLANLKMFQIGCEPTGRRPTSSDLSVALISVAELQARAVASYNLHLSRKRGYGTAWKLITLASAQWRLDRVAVNYIRHHLTAYDDLVASLNGDDRDALRQLQHQVFAAIGVAYPQFAGECTRQAGLRGVGCVRGLTARGP